MQAARCRSASPFSKGLRLHPVIAPFNFGPAVKLSGTEADGVGVWKFKGSTVVIDWISGWRSSLSLDPATPLRLRHWPPGSDRQGRRVA